MCYKPLQILNRSTYIGAYSPVMLQVPCGKCCECRDQKAFDLQMRCEYALIGALSQGGYGFFDTLTYKPECLPHYENIPCFSRKDVGAFIKRLRSRIDYHLRNNSSYNAANVLDYCLVSEFGGDYGRPHYHILFFISCPASVLSVATLKWFITESWTYGFVDGMQHTYNHIINSTNIVRYITKYVTKFSEWFKKYDEDLQKIFSDNGVNSKNHIKQVRRKMMPFYRCSEDLGVSALKNSSDFDIVNGTIKLSTSYGPKIYPLSRYFKYKFYYRLTRCNDKYIYLLNEDGINYKLNLLYNSIDRYTEDCRNILYNIDPEKRDEILFYLGERSLYDFSVYVYVYKGCIFSKTIDMQPEEFYLKSRFPSEVRINEMYSDDFNNFDYVRKIRNSYISRCIDESITEFANYDKIYRIINEYNYQNGVNKENTQNMRDNVKSKLLNYVSNV